jgi:ribonuclease P protein component
VLARAHRISKPSEIRRLSRGGQRLASRFFVARLHAGDGSMPSRFAFIVSKQVGGAVVRNRVKRRLRTLAHEELVAHPTGWDVVVRALPPAADVSYQDIEQSWRGAFSEAKTE